MARERAAAQVLRDRLASVRREAATSPLGARVVLADARRLEELAYHALVEAAHAAVFRTAVEELLAAVDAAQASWDRMGEAPDPEVQEPVARARALLDGNAGKRITEQLQALEAWRAAHPEEVNSAD